MNIAKPRVRVNIDRSFVDGSPLPLRTCFGLICDLAANNEWESAAQQIETCRSSYPSSWIPVELLILEIKAKRIIGQQSEAVKLCASARERFPDNLGLRVEVMRNATEFGEWDKIVAQAAAFREMKVFTPLLLDVFILEIKALRTLRRLLEAEAQYENGQKLFANAPGLAYEYIRNAVVMNDWHEVLRRSSSLPLKDLPHDVPQDIYSWRLYALRILKRHEEADEVGGRLAAKFPDQLGYCAELIRNAAACGDHAEALMRMKKLEMRWRPDQIPHDVYYVKLRALRTLKRYEEADEVGGRLSAKFPDQLEYCAELIRNAAAFGDHAEALARMKKLEMRWSPDQTPPDVHRIKLRALRILKRHEEADDVGGRLAAKYPDQLGYCVELIRNAAAFGDHAEALARMKKLEMRWSPDQTPPDVHRQSIRSRRSLGQHKEADTHGVWLAKRFPHEKIYAIELINNSVALSRYEETLRRIDDYFDRFNDAPAQLYVFKSAALRGLERYRESEMVCRDALSAHPDSDVILMEWVKVSLAVRNILKSTPAATREELEEACRQGLKKWPYQEELHSLLIHISVAHNDMEGAFDCWTRAISTFPQLKITPLGLRFTQKFLVSTSKSDEEKAVFSEFLSLGSAALHGCEFGMIQKLFDIQQLHLLRFAVCPVVGLIKMLNDGFAGLVDDDDDDIQLYCYEYQFDEESFRVPYNHYEEYRIISKQYKILAHSHVHDFEMRAVECLDLFRRRWPFLARKFLEDLKMGRNFIYKYHPELVSFEELKALYAHLRSYGDNNLLAVRMADDRNQPGSVTRVDQGFVIGHINRFWGPENNNIRPADWFPICSQALNYFHRL